MGSSSLDGVALGASGLIIIKWESRAGGQLDDLDEGGAKGGQAPNEPMAIDVEHRPSTWESDAP